MPKAASEFIRSAWRAWEFWASVFGACVVWAGLLFSVSFSQAARSRMDRSYIHTELNDMKSDLAYLRDVVKRAEKRAVDRAAQQSAKIKELEKNK